ncbi:hypothetical protein TrST_g5793 [Triparma strigata]|uniref:SET domain-containing protein n=1 Tax=Triparma strigata TaxID=1606541 RepID=A0A9W7BXS3_9STRA|nr:hypothetical protein TrST_g5793 [Triparma strigata]
MASVLLPPIPPLTVPPHLRIIDVAGAGRNLVLAERQAEGAVVLVDEPFCHIVHQRFRRFTCDNCYNFTSIDGPNLRFPCSETSSSCGVHYCSASCRSLKKPRHSKVCSLTNLVSSSPRKKKKSSDKALETYVNLLLSAVSNPSPLRYLENCLPETPFTPSTPGKSKRLTTYSSAESTLRTLLPCPLPSGSYSRAVSTSHFNAVGLYDEYGEESGFVLSPLMAMVNHSCYPNCGQYVEDGKVKLRALRDLEVGEEIFYSYVSIGGGTTGEERRKDIEGNWGFVSHPHQSPSRSSKKIANMKGEMSFRQLGNVRSLKL